MQLSYVLTVVLSLATTTFADSAAQNVVGYVYSTNQTGVDCSALVPATTYTVVSGDTLQKIATAFGVALCSLEAANTQITNYNFIDVGDVLNIPAQTCGTPACATATTSSTLPTATCASSSNSTYTVTYGDTLYIIATEKFGITLAALELANPQIENFDVIEIGEVINIPDCVTAKKLVRSWRARREAGVPLPRRSEGEPKL